MNVLANRQSPFYLKAAEQFAAMPRHFTFASVSTSEKKKKKTSPKYNILTVKFSLGFLCVLSFLHITFKVFMGQAFILCYICLLFEVLTAFPLIKTLGK